MACQLSMTLNRSFLIVPNAQIAIGVPRSGQCLDMGRGSKDKDCGDCVVAGIYPQHSLVRFMQKRES
jgi:hypothetical protein